jgi:nucleotide-binding universal stress UspA family protein
VNTFEDSRAGAEARRAVVGHSGGPTRHEHALQQYLVAEQYEMSKETTGSGGTSGPVAPPAAEDAPSAEAAAPEAGPGEDPAGSPSCPPGAVVVGVDGSTSSAAAVAWAADEAGRRHAVLRLVHAYRLPTMAGYPGYNAIPDDLLEQLRAAGEHLLDTTAAALADDHPDLTIVRTLFQGRGEQALRSLSEHAQLTVVGHAAATRAAGVLLGSVAFAVTATNPVPVAVIPTSHSSATGPIVVGVDGSPLSEAAVGFAFDEASIRGTDLIAVHAWNDVYLDSRRLEPLLIDPRMLEQQERALLSERLAGWTEKYPDVPVRKVLVHQRPTAALLQYSRSASAVVVGSHGRGGFAGMILGSTSHALATHAHCPVIVVRTTERSTH